MALLCVRLRLPALTLSLGLLLASGACKSRDFNSEGAPKASSHSSSTPSGKPPLEGWAHLEWYKDAQLTPGVFRLLAEKACPILGGLADDEESSDAVSALNQNLRGAARQSASIWDDGRNPAYIEKDAKGVESLSRTHPNFGLRADLRVAHYLTIAELPLSATKRRELCADMTARADAAEKAIWEARSVEGRLGEDRMTFLLRIQDHLKPRFGDEPAPEPSKLTFQQMREVSIWSRESFGSRQFLAWLLDAALLKQELDNRKKSSARFEANLAKWKAAEAKARDEREAAEKAAASAGSVPSQSCVAIITLEGEPLIWTRSFIDRSRANTPLLKRFQWPLTTVVATGNDRASTSDLCEVRKRERANMHEEYGYTCKVECE